MSPVPTRNILAILSTAAFALAACTAASPSGGAQSASVAGSPAATPLPAAMRSGEPYTPQIDPADFVAVVDNPYFPLLPGTRWVMEGAGESAGEVTTTEVTRDTKTILGVVCTVVHDQVTADGELKEDTLDWYAQDAAGNVWYFGEETAEYEGGQVTSTEGSWEAGVDGAQPGIIMPADPEPDVVYRQEFYAGEAEDLAKVVELAASVDTPFGQFSDVLVTEDWTPLEPKLVEHKFYAPDVGLVMERLVRGGEATNQLTEYTEGG